MNIFDDDDNDNDDDDENQNGHNSANFQARTSSFCMVVDLDNTYRMMPMMMIMMMVTMMMIKRTMMMIKRRMMMKMVIAISRTCQIKF